MNAATRAHSVEKKEVAADTLPLIWPATAAMPAIGTPFISHPFIKHTHSCFVWATATSRSFAATPRIRFTALLAGSLAMAPFTPRSNAVWPHLTHSAKNYASP